MSKTVLVCGGRDYTNYPILFPILEDIISVNDTVIHGNAIGADFLTKCWAIHNSRKQVPYPADWGKHKLAAGPIRNKQMLEEGKPDLVIAFPGGKGTANMIKIALEAGVGVIPIE